MMITGKIVSGVGESSEWMPKYISWLYPGTLNVYLELPIDHNFKWIKIIDTHYKKPAKIASCLINAEEAFIILPPLANKIKHPNLIEIGASFNIRKRFNLNNNDLVTLNLNNNDLVTITII